MELLAPAGNYESMVAAVQNGANAVYLGGQLFSARKFAGNFSNEELRRAIAYCHARDVQVYVTFNTLLIDRELDAAFQFGRFLHDVGADAAIVQDMGLVHMLRAAFPALPVHASTQMGIHDENGLATLQALGISRAVLARELSLERITTLSKANSGIELECFAHGALCTAMSGTCLFSSLAGGRSGNRGACAQPCRKQYQVDDGTLCYPLSLEDLCMLTNVGALKQAGIAALKLEGRMKRAEYVAAMVRAYRRAIDDAEESELQPLHTTMRQVFERGACTGYYYGRNVPSNARGALSQNDAPLDALRQTYRAEFIKRPIDAALTLPVEENARLRLRLGDVAVEAEGALVEPAEKAQNADAYAAKIAKLGDTPFSLNTCAVDMPAPAYLPVSALNALRRSAVDALIEALGRARTPVFANIPPVASTQSDAQEVLALVPDQISAVAAFEAGADMVAFSPRFPAAAHAELLSLQHFRAQGKLLLAFPAADFAREWDYTPLYRDGLLDGGIAQNIGQVNIIKGLCVAGYLLNAANAQAVAHLKGLGFSHVCLSLELNRAQMRDLIPLGDVGIYAYGRAQLMQLWHCPAHTEGGCTSCKDHALTDESGRVFPLDPVHGENGCLTRVRNCEVMDILDVLHMLPAPSFATLEFSGESASIVQERVRAAKLALGGESAKKIGTTRGHWSRGLE